MKMNFRVIYLNGCGSRCIRIGSWKSFERIYDFILLAVRENQLHMSLAERKANTSPVIVTIVILWKRMIHGKRFVEKDVSSLLFREPGAESVVLMSRVD